MHVGRTVSGLPLDRPEFGIVGPFFLGNSDIIYQAVNQVFPLIPEGMTQIGEYALASIVYHSEYLRANLHPQNPVLHCILFRDNFLLNSLKAMVRTALPGDENGRFTTGVPPHINMLNQMNQVKNNLMQLVPEIQNVSKVTVENLVKELEERAIGAGTVTRDGLEALLRNVVAEAIQERMPVVDGNLNGFQEIEDGNIEQTHQKI